MASKINTDNPKHHKYISVNKQERKKTTIDNINYNKINILNFKSFLLVLEAVVISCQYSYRYLYKKFGFTQGKHTNQLEPNYHSTYGHNKGTNSIYHGIGAPKGTCIIYDDCNHKSFRVYNKKKHKFISSIYRERRYSNLYIAPKHFKR